MQQKSKKIVKFILPIPLIIAVIWLLILLSPAILQTGEKPSPFVSNILGMIIGFVIFYGFAMFLIYIKMK
jgi:hypothetical protein